MDKLITDYIENMVEYTNSKDPKYLMTLRINKAALIAKNLYGELVELFYGTSLLDLDHLEKLVKEKH